MLIKDEPFSTLYRKIQMKSLFGNFSFLFAIQYNNSRRVKVRKSISLPFKNDKKGGLIHEISFKMLHM